MLRLELAAHRDVSKFDPFGSKTSGSKVTSREKFITDELSYGG